MELHPTLWRTCRVLAGLTRLRLLKEIIMAPGQSVSRLADSIGIKLSRASQELRRLNSRGLVTATRAGPEVRYSSRTDPQVPAAAPLLDALSRSLRRNSESALGACRRAAKGFSHPRRIAIGRELLRGPRTFAGLAFALKMPSVAVRRHLRIMLRFGAVRRRGKHYAFIPGTHPLSRCLTRLLTQHPA